MNSIVKYVSIIGLFGIWFFIVYDGKVGTPGADVFISWIQMALVGLGVIHISNSMTSKTDDSKNSNSDNAKKE